MMKEIRIGLVGSGWMGKSHSSALADAQMLFGDVYKRQLQHYCCFSPFSAPFFTDPLPVVCFPKIISF